MSLYNQQRAYQAARQAAYARAMAARQAKLLRDAQSDAARMAAAEQARSQGDISLACRLYLRVAASRPATPFSQVARNKLQELGTEGQSKFEQLSGQLAQWQNMSASEVLSRNDGEQLQAVVKQLDKLSKEYSRVPKAGKQIKLAVSRQRNRPFVRAALHEPDAAALWEKGQQLEAAGQVCCAMQLYEEAKALLPAPSARQAVMHLESLAQDPEHVKAADRCKNLQWCHQRFRVAEMVARSDPGRARQLFAEIARRAPHNSEIYVAVQQRLGHAGTDS